MERYLIWANIVSHINKWQTGRRTPADTRVQRQFSKKMITFLQANSQFSRQAASENRQAGHCQELKGPIANRDLVGR